MSEWCSECGELDTDAPGFACIYDLCPMVPRKPLQWRERKNMRFAFDGPLQYRITMAKAGNKWVFVAHLNRDKIGGSFETVEAAMEYIEHGGEQPRRPREQTP